MAVVHHTIPMDIEVPTLALTAACVETQRAVTAMAATLAGAASVAVAAQWTAMHALPGDAMSEATIIDPEALLLISLWLLPREPALLPIVHDWVARWSDLLSVQRTRNIARAYSAPVLAELRAVAVTAHERGKDFRWSPVIKSGTGAAGAGTTDDEVAPSRGDSRPPLPFERLAVERDALLVLRFRMAFGVGARADALAYLLARGSAWSTVTEIALATGYTPSAIRRALDRMAEADIVLMVDDGTTRFRCDPTRWSALLGLQSTVAPWRYFLQHFTFVASFVEWAESVSRRKLTSYSILDQLRGVARTFRPTDDRDALRTWDSAFREGSTWEEMEAALATVANALTMSPIASR